MVSLPRQNPELETCPAPSDVSPGVIFEMFGQNERFMQDVWIPVMVKHFHRSTGTCDVKVLKSPLIDGQGLSGVTLHHISLRCMRDFSGNPAHGQS